MLLVFVKTLLLSVPDAVNKVPCAVDAVSCDRKLDRSSSPAASQGGASRVGVGAMMFPCTTCCLGALVEVGFGRRSDGVLDVVPRWSFDGRCGSEENVLVDCEEEVESPRDRDQGLDATL
jgi:hypothetical protein